jgi:hypothetical protein
MNRESKAMVAAASRNVGHHWLRQGTRMGEEDEGGPLWIDWDNFIPISGIDQIVGHTVHKRPKFRVVADNDRIHSFNAMIDGNGAYAAIVREGKISIIHARGPDIGKTYDKFN